jgi:hypothetical protein
LADVFASGEALQFSYKRLEEIRGFLCHAVSMTYPLVTPYLTGFHLTLAAHHLGGDDSGWKLTPHEEWAAYLYKAVALGKMVQDKADALQEAV